jgi:cytochrome b pre-mRNA-processing protein 3
MRHAHFDLASALGLTKPAASRGTHLTNPMIFPFFGRSRRRGTISVLYGTIVAQARMPGFYRDYAVPDMLNGRFELIVLHLAVLLDRFAQDPALRGLGQGVFDHFCQDMDSNLREIGVGDLAVPKEMRRIGEAFYGRAQVYGAALAAADDQALADALTRNIYGATASPAAVRLAAYMREAVRDLKAQDSACLAAGRLRFPDPTAVHADAD